MECFGILPPLITTNTFESTFESLFESMFESTFESKDDMHVLHDIFVLQNYSSWKYVWRMTCMSCMIHLYCKNIRVESTFEEWHACLAWYTRDLSAFSLLVLFMKYTLMPCPFTGPKMFCASTIFLSQYIF